MILAHDFQNLKTIMILVKSIIVIECDSYGSTNISIVIAYPILPAALSCTSLWFAIAEVGICFTIPVSNQHHEFCFIYNTIKRCANLLFLYLIIVIHVHLFFNHLYFQNKSFVDHKNVSYKLYFHPTVKTREHSTLIDDYQLET